MTEIKPRDPINAPVPAAPRNVADIVAAQMKQVVRADPVNHPPHYNAHPSGVEAIDIIEYMNFCRGNAIKYIWRAGEKGNEIQDLEKARWYLDREIQRMKKHEQRKS